MYRQNRAIYSIVTIEYFLEVVRRPYAIDVIKLSFFFNFLNLILMKSL